MKPICSVAMLLVATTAALAQASASPRMQVSPERWELGHVEPGRYQQVFEVTNSGGGTLVIDEVRVSNPQRMSASVVPLGTEPGRRYQVTLVVDTGGLDSRFEGYIVVHANDEARPDVRIDVVGEPAATASGLLLFYSEEGPAIAALRAHAATLPKGQTVEFLYVGELANVARLRSLEKERGVTRGGAFELFRGREWLVTADPGDVRRALDRLVAGKSLTGRDPVPHDHGQTPSAPALVEPLAPPPIVVEFFYDPACEACATAFHAGVEGLARDYSGRIGIRPRDLSLPESTQALAQVMTAEALTPARQAVAVVGGTYVAGDMEAVFAALPRVVEEALAASSPPAATRSLSFTNELKIAPSLDAPRKDGEAETDGPAQELGDWATWVVVIPVFVLLLNCLLMLKVSKLVSRTGTPAPPK